MIVPIAAILVLWLLLSRADAFSRVRFRMSPAFSGKLASIGAVLLALIVLLRGEVWLALVLFGFALWLLGRSSGKRDKKTSKAAVSHARSATVEMDYDPRTGAITGRVVSGLFAGRRSTTSTGLNVPDFISRHRRPIQRGRDS
jgi:hypothetical protein